MWTDAPKYNTICGNIVQQFEGQGLFNEARVFAEVAKIPNEEITFHQVGYWMRKKIVH